MTKPENMYETPSIPADKNDLESLQRKFVIGSIFLAVIALIAIVAVGIAVYAATRDVENNNPGGPQTMNNGLTPGSGSSTACNQVECENGGSCFNIYPDNYMCACVATFYGRNCQHGEWISRSQNRGLQNLQDFKKIFFFYSCIDYTRFLWVQFH